MSGKKDIKYITVAEVIECLNQLPKDLPIIYASDDEGNQFNLVNFTPSIKIVKELTSRDMETCDENEEGIQVVCIN